MVNRPKVLLHICCGICACHCIKYLKENNFEVTGYFYNPNIYPLEEYQKRKYVVEQIQDIFSIQIIYDEYENDLWMSLCQEYKNETEGSIRCKTCYRLRLQKTYQKLRELSFDFFTTTLTISPHKNSAIIFETAKEINNQKFLKIDFKQQNGFKKTLELSKSFNLYRQNYCGCVFSSKPN
ncbi:MAG: epoxyqueuosine reductase QueH [Endomicrobia bacterium]|nr:epoxyqueuosine reductase QueH [Endomicrobiia bacterium]